MYSAICSSCPGNRPPGIPEPLPFVMISVNSSYDKEVPTKAGPTPPPKSPP